MNKTQRLFNTEKNAIIRARLRIESWNKAKRMAILYVFIMIPVVTLIIFHYIPIAGIQLAFKDFRVDKGIWGSPWNNFRHFRMLISNPFFGRIFANTIIISVMRIIFGFPAPIILALLINEVRNMFLKRTIQSISYLPHFMSWVVLAGILFEVLSPQRGLAGYITKLLGGEPKNLFADPNIFRPLLIITGIWQSVGWQTILYLAAIASIDPSLYEVAEIDGANRLQRAIFITIPSIIPVITILFLLRLGYIMNAGFDQIFNMYNPLVYRVADIIDTYEYRVGLIDRRYDFSTAVGLFKNVIGVTLLVGTNAIVKRFSEYALW